jgi:hypothetical protein
LTLAPRSHDDCAGLRENLDTSTRTPTTAAAAANANARAAATSCAYAALSGHLRAAVGAGASLPVELVDAGIGRCGHLEVLQWLREND